MKQLVLVGGLLLLAVIAALAFTLQDQAQIISAKQPWYPASLRIDAININAPIINVGKDSAGRMDAPVSQAIKSPYWTSVFWYALGPAPGQAGNAVIAGHVDRVGGDPAIFWQLSHLQRGDMIIITTIGKSTLRFKVEQVQKYPVDTTSESVLNSIFGYSTEHRLNLITCDGPWTGQQYSDRLVVFSKQVS